MSIRPNYKLALNTNGPRSTLAYAKTLVLTIFGLGLLFLAGCGPVENVRLEEPACPRGVGHGFWDFRWWQNDNEDPPANDVERLLSRPNFGATSEAAGDLREGIVDERLQDTLLTISEEHSICIRSFKDGHRFFPGVEDGPTIPEGYGDAGGLPNTHYFGRAADIFWADGMPVENNGREPAILDIGRMLADMPPQQRPDQIIGPPGWTNQLDYGISRGWITAQDQVDLHRGHLHLGYREQSGTNNIR